MMSYDRDFSLICRNRKEINDSVKALKQGIIVRFLKMTWYRLLKTEKKKRFKAGNFEKLVVLSHTEYFK